MIRILDRGLIQSVEKSQNLVTDPYGEQSGEFSFVAYSSMPCLFLTIEAVAHAFCSCYGFVE